MSMKIKPDLFAAEDEDAKRLAIRQGLADLDSGLAVGHGVVSTWLARLAAGERPPAPLSTRKP